VAGVERCSVLLGVLLDGMVSLFCATAIAPCAKEVLLLLLLLFLLQVVQRVNAYPKIILSNDKGDRTSVRIDNWRVSSLQLLLLLLLLHACVMRDGFAIQCCVQDGSAGFTRGVTC
jgi:hypothetical protein